MAKRKINNNDKKEQENREKVKLRVRKYREALKNNPEKYEEAKRLEKERYQRRKEQGKIKSIKELTSREQRKLRKDWRARSKKSYDKKHKAQELVQAEVESLETIIPPLICENHVQTPEQKTNIFETPTVSGRSTAGKKRSRTNRRKLSLKIQKLKEELKKEKAKKEKYKKRLYRHRDPEKDSPNSNVKRIINGQTVTTEVKRALLFGAVLSTQIKQNISAKNTRESRRKVMATVSGKVIKKYRFQERLKVLAASKRLLYSKKSKTQFDTIWTEVRKKIRNFYENDDSSRMCPGKKETKTFKKVKKQKRYLNYSLKELHAKFCSTYSDLKVSYNFFCKLRPFWVVPLNVNERDTCLCETHVNFQYVVSKLKFYNMIRESSSNEVIKSVTCSTEGKIKETCFRRECPKCKTKTVEFLDYNTSEHVRYEKWLSKKEKLLVKGQEKICIKKVKETIYCNKKELVLEFQKTLPKFVAHHFNMLHQYEKIKEIKRNLSNHDVLIHMDFSENYGCKYSTEVQSAHFGGSKPQVTLHTVVTYQKPQQATDETEPIVTSYCTLSKSLRHDPSAICAHLSPVINDIKQKCPILNEVHCLSDGPSTQYKNKKMFFLLTKLAKLLCSNSLRWHYFESHHGKGAPDGIGGCVKRTADSIVARGEDIPNYETLLDKLQTLKGVNILPIDEKEILAFDSKLPMSLKAFQGTMKIHEVLWTKVNPSVIRFRQLTCSNCTADEVCMHYDLGSIQYNSEAEDVEDSNSSCDEIMMDISKNISNQINMKKKLCYEDVDSSSEKSFSSEDELPLSKFVRRHSSLHVDDYVLVKILGKKNQYYHYVAVIISVENKNEYTVKYFRKSSKENFFIFPNVEDIGLISTNDIVSVLENPQIKRGHHFFTVPEFSNLR